MPRNKKSKRHGPGPPASARKGQWTDSRTHKFRENEAEQSFSMRDTARNTDSRSARNSGSLRNRHIGFVSAGTMVTDFVRGEAQPSKSESSDDAAINNVSMSESKIAQPLPPVQLHSLDSSVQLQGPQAYDFETCLVGQAEPQVISNDGESRPYTALKTDRQSSHSPTPSDSSEEVLLFTGRNTSQPKITGDGVRDSHLSDAKDLIDFTNESVHKVTTEDTSETFHATSHSTFNGKRTKQKTTQTNRLVFQGSRPSAFSDVQMPGSNHDEALADYYQNIQQAESADDKVESSKPSGRRNHHLSRGIRDMGSKAEGLTPELFAPSGSTALPIHADDLQLSDLDCSESDNSLDTVDQATRDLEAALADVDFDDNLFGFQGSKLSDERLAQLLTKQEELGMGSESLLLLDGAGSESREEVDLDHLQREADRFANRTTRRKNKRFKNRSSEAMFSNSFDLEGIEDDSYGQFEVMNRGRRSIADMAMAGTLSDSDLEESMHQAWQQDRQKKKFRKQEREELRSQGLLGKHGKHGKVDMKAKYSDGMNFDQLSEEVRHFLTSGSDSLALPAMDKRSRKIVHEIANVLNLKSKSIGDGQKRHPCLYRTSRTADYDPAIFASMKTRISRRYLGVASRRGPVKGNPRRGGGMQAASYQDGDVVGAAAPELGSDNKGRAMLEKMGWSSGTALGAVNNKGMLQPVVHIVKKSRAGLG